MISGCYYNKDAFDNAGVAYPTNDKATFEQYDELARKMTKYRARPGGIRRTLHKTGEARSAVGILDGKNSIRDGKVWSFKALL